MVTARDLLVRGNIRFDIALPARAAVGDEHARKVRLGEASGAVHGWVPVDVVDVSAGGIGLVSGTFFPRRTLLRVEIMPFTAEGGAAAGESGVVMTGEPLMRCQVRVQRVVMTDRRPAYLLGTSFADSGSEFDEALDGFLRKLDGVVDLDSQSESQLSD